MAFQGGPGWRTLDLGRLAPQPGYQATATATQAEGFQPRRVVRIEIDMGGSGAVDNLVYGPKP